jgi:hypothetical protein
MRLEKLPRWAVADAEAERREIEELRRLTPDEKVAVLAAVCSAGAKLLAMNEHRDEVLRHEDPLPRSTVGT